MATPPNDYVAAAETAACFDLTGRAQIEITGSDRAKFLHNFCTNDIKRLGSGDGCEAFVTNIKGRVLGHMFVFATDDALWIDTVAGADEALIPHLDRYLITEDAVINSRTEEFGELFVTGPQAANLISSLGIGVDNLSHCGHQSFELSDAMVTVCRVDWFNQPGYLLLVAREQLEQVQQVLAANGVTSGTLETFNALRIEAGFPLYGEDISEENLAQEVGRTEQAISFTKGCYLGQEPIARIDAMGHVNRQLSRLKLTSGLVPNSGAEIFTADSEKPIGEITSASLSPADDLPVSLAYLRTQFASPGTQVDVDVDGNRTAAMTVG